MRPLADGVHQREERVHQREDQLLTQARCCGDEITPWFQRLIDLPHRRHPVVEQVQDVHPEDGIIAVRRGGKTVHIRDPESDVLNAFRRQLVASNADHLRRHVNGVDMFDIGRMQHSGRACPAAKFQDLRVLGEIFAGEIKLDLIGFLIGDGLTRIFLRGLVPKFGKETYTQIDELAGHLV